MLCLEQERTKRTSILKCLMEEIASISLHKHGVNYCVMGEGNVLSNSLIIGEALGKEEEENRRIFIGRSGKVLRKMLQSLNIENKVFLVNAIPWRPLNNRTPIASEIKTYSLYIKEIIRILGIDNIILLGSVAKSIFYNDKVMKDVLSNIRHSSTFHPSFFLRNHSCEVSSDIFNTLISFSKNIKCPNEHFYVFSHESQSMS